MWLFATMPGAEHHFRVSDQTLFTYILLKETGFVYSNMFCLYSTFCTGQLDMHWEIYCAKRSFLAFKTEGVIRHFTVASVIYL
jgi:hypothetical protein